ncbi:hypothetical protein [Nocardia sp. IFM 10818]
MDPEALRRNAQQSQRGAEQEQRRISGSAVDPDYVQRLEHFGGLSHEQIYAAVQAMNPGDMHTAAETWVDIADNLCGDIHGLIITVQGALADGLAGRIADAADIAARQFAGQAMDVAEILHSTGHRMAAAAYGAEALRKTVPPPPVPLQGDQSDPTATYLALILGAAPGDAHSFEAAREEQYRLALAALEANYIPIYPPAGSGVPAFSPSRCPARTATTPQALRPAPPQASAPHPHSSAPSGHTSPLPNRSATAARTARPPAQPPQRPPPRNRPPHSRFPAQPIPIRPPTPHRATAR